MYEEEEEEETAAEPQGEEGEEEDDDNEECEICHDIGELILCDYCPKALHAKCAGLVEAPHGNAIFTCHECGTDTCDICKSPEATVRCQYCRRAYHGECLHRVPAPEDIWLCPSCVKEAAEQNGVEKILATRPCRKMAPAEEARRLKDWTALAASEKSARNRASTSGATAQPARASALEAWGPPRVGEDEYLVRWTGKAYWHASWVSETSLASVNKAKLRKFQLRQATASAFKLPAEAAETEEEEVIEAAWCLADRILDEREDRSVDGLVRLKEYLVKWRGLEYEQSTWEMEGDLRKKGFGAVLDHFANQSQDWVRPLLSLEDPCQEAPDGEGEKNLSFLRAGPGGGRLAYKPLEAQPPCFKGGSWHDYQLIGINFLRNAWHAGNNVILADEMGLGKTIQTLGFLRCLAVEQRLARAGGSGGETEGKFLPFLVVCPLAVVDNWERECSVWCPDLDVVVYKGSQRSREMIQRYEARPIRATMGVEGNGSISRARKKRKLGDGRAQGGDGEPPGGEGGSEEGAGGDHVEEGEVKALGGKVRSKAVSQLSKHASAALKRRRCGNSEERRLDVKFHVMITSFEYAWKDAFFFKKLRWEAVVVDEGHRLKGGVTGRLYQALKEMRVGHRVLLTGTPLQNSIEELFNLLHFLEPGKFADVEIFKAEFASMDKEEQLAKLHDLIAPHMLRRLKKDVNLAIPEKHELIVRVELTPVQKNYYKLILAQNFELLRRKFKAASSIYNMIMQLKKVCNHPFLMQEEDLCYPVDQDYSARAQALLSSSGKLELLDRMLLKLKAGGHRVLLFSQMTTMLDLLEEHVMNRGWRYQRLDGSTRATERQARIDAFNRRSLKHGAKEGKEGEDYFIFLLSTRAGGLGINLTSADTVIIYDLDWNPHNDLQALARAHRIGQTRKVMVYRLITRDSVEERTLQLAKKKLLLEHVVVGEAGRGRNMTQEELDDVLKYGTEELFAEEEGEKARNGEEETECANAKKWGDGGTSKSSKRILWDEEAVDRLLDRDGEEDGRGERLESGTEAMVGEESGEERKTGKGLSGLFQSFKVARFASVEDVEAEAAAARAAAAAEAEGNEDKAEVLRREREAALLRDALPDNTEKSWVELLGSRQESFKAEEVARLGKGKRERREVVRPAGTYQGPLSEFLSGSDDGGEEEEEQGEEDYEYESDEKEEDAEYDVRSRRQSTAAATSQAGPARVLVPGFGESQRRAIRGYLMRFGLTKCGDFKSFYEGLSTHAAGRLAERSAEEVRHYLQCLLASGSPREGSVRALCAVESDLLQRVAVMGLIDEKVREFEAQDPESFFIDDGRQTAWCKACVITTKAFKLTWGRAQDLLLLELTIRHGYGRWTAFLQDEDFIASVPPRALVHLSHSPGPAPAISTGGMEEEGEHATRKVPAPEGVSEAEAHKETREGSAMNENSSRYEATTPEARRRAYTSGQERQLLAIIGKRMKLMSQALVIEKQRLQRKIRALARVQEHVSKLVSHENYGGKPFPPRELRALLERRRSVHCAIQELFDRLRQDPRLIGSTEVLVLEQRLDEHQGRLCALTQKNRDLLLKAENARSKMILGSSYLEDLNRQASELEAVTRSVQESMQNVTSGYLEMEGVLSKHYGPKTASRQSETTVLEATRGNCPRLAGKEESELKEKQKLRVPAQEEGKALSLKQGQGGNEGQSLPMVQQETVGSQPTQSTNALEHQVLPQHNEVPALKKLPPSSVAQDIPQSDPAKNIHGRLADEGMTVAAPKENSGNGANFCDDNSEKQAVDGRKMQGCEEVKANSSDCEAVDCGNGVAAKRHDIEEERP